MTSSPPSVPSNIQTAQTLQDRGYQPKVARKLELSHDYSAEERPIVETINKWHPELMNPSKYGHILSMGVGLKREGHRIIVPHETCIVIYVEHKNALTANIPTSLDGIPVDVIDTGGGIIAATETCPST